MAFSQWIKEWSIVLSSGATLILALVAIWAVLKPIRENRSIRAEDKYRKSSERSLAFVQNWLDSIIKFKSDSSGPPGTPEERRLRKWNLEYLIVKVDQVILEARRFNALSSERPALTDNISSLAEVLRRYNYEEFGAERPQQELRQLSLEVMKNILTIKAKLKL
jgi:ribosome-binding protein aMBF1 (putative translation factor)